MAYTAPNWPVYIALAVGLRKIGSSSSVSHCSNDRLYTGNVIEHRAKAKSSDAEVGRFKYY